MYMAYNTLYGAVKILANQRLLSIKSRTKEKYIYHITIFLHIMYFGCYYGNTILTSYVMTQTALHTPQIKPVLYFCTINLDYMTDFFCCKMIYMYLSAKPDLLIVSPNPFYSDTIYVVLLESCIVFRLPARDNILVCLNPYFITSLEAYTTSINII